MTGNRPKLKGVGAREAGRQLGVSHTYLLRLAKQNRLPRHDDGSFDVSACREWLAKNTDPAQVRGPSPARWSDSGDPAGNPVTSDQAKTSNPSGLRGVSLLAFEAARHTDSEFEAGFVSAVIALAHQVGAVAGLAAMEEGAPLPIAFAVEQAFPVFFIERAEMLLRDMPSFRAVPAHLDLPTGYVLEWMDRVDWDVIAAERGTTADVAAWAAAAHERRRGKPE